jgi:hypothetical protein
VLTFTGSISDKALTATSPSSVAVPQFGDDQIWNIPRR